jgi:hypothetical protein
MVFEKTHILEVLEPVCWDRLFFIWFI